jgi:hypothetical protein
LSNRISWGKVSFLRCENSGIETRSHHFLRPLKVRHFSEILPGCVGGGYNLGNHEELRVGNDFALKLTSWVNFGRLFSF